MILKFTLVKLKVFDLTGREIASIVNKQLNPDIYEVPFDGSFLTAGVYFYRLEARTLVQIRMFILQK
jgi:hypothetical protein